MSAEHSEWLHAARTAMVVEAKAIMAAYHRLGDDFCRAVQTILDHQGKVVVTGLGKSGLVARKLAATLCSTGTPAVYLHPVEALHGDIGIVAQGNPVIMISRSGATPELVGLVEALRRMVLVDTPLIGIVGTPGSWLALTANVVLDVSFEREADPLNLVPTASAAVAMAIGDALACVLMHARGVTAEDLRRLHPAGNGTGV